MGGGNEMMKEAERETERERGRARERQDGQPGVEGQRRGEELERL